MNVLDLVAIAIIVFGAYRGWKYGFISSAISLVGSIFIFIVAYYIKNPLSVLMYENLPFRSYGGIFSGITSFNILVYEVIAYLICILVLAAILRVIVKVTGIVDKILNLTLILALPSKILGLVLGALQYFVYTFMLLFILSVIPFTATNFKDSTVSIKIVQKTPLLSNITNELYNTISEVYDVCSEADNKDNSKEGDFKSLDVLMKNKVISVDSVKKLVEKNKINIEDVDTLIEKYSEAK